MRSALAQNVSAPGPFALADLVSVTAMAAFNEHLLSRSNQIKAQFYRFSGCFVSIREYSLFEHDLGHSGKEVKLFNESRQDPCPPTMRWRARQRRLYVYNHAI